MDSPQELNEPRGAPQGPVQVFPGGAWIYSISQVIDLHWYNEVRPEVITRYRSTFFRRFLEEPRRARRSRGGGAPPPGGGG